MALFTTMPTSMIAPIRTMTVTVVPVTSSPATTPTSANGIVNSTINGCRNDSKVAAITR